MPFSSILFCVEKKDRVFRALHQVWFGLIFFLHIGESKSINDELAWALVSFAVRLHLCIFDSVLYKGTWISESLLSLACCSVVTSVFTTDYRCSHKRNEFFKCTNNHSHSSNCIPIQHWLIFLFAIANTHTHGKSGPFAIMRIDFFAFYTHGEQQKQVIW